jgi:hypothetical protein
MDRIAIGRIRSVGRSLGAPALAALLAMSLTMGAGDVCLARAPHQLTFSTPQNAVDALFQAIRNNNDAALTAILGARKPLICSDDSDRDMREQAQFVEKYRQMHRLVREADGSTVLYIGAENWPFPFPVVLNKGAWRFDTAAGLHEILFRRIGENETATIETCRALADSHGARAADLETGSLPVHGYIFRRLTATSRTNASNGGNAVEFPYIAYPAMYRSSGVMTFVVRRDGVIYARDLGPGTARRAKEMSRFLPDATWAVEK